MFDAIKKGFQAARSLFAAQFAAIGESPPTRNEMTLDADEFNVKRKLGKSFFTRQLSHNARVARILSLSQDEYQLASEKGWL